MAHIEKGPSGQLMLRDDWFVEDVAAECPWLTESEAEQVLDELAHAFDANIGINWDVIRYTADLLFPEDKQDDSLA